MKNKKNWLTAALVLAVAVLLYLLLSGGKDHDTHTSDHAQAVATRDTLQVHGADYRRVIDSLSIDNYRLDSANKSLVKGQQKTEQKLNAKAAEVTTLLEQIREINQDTGYFGHLLDSLKNQVANLNFLIVQYEQYADSINTVNDSLKINCDATKKEPDKRIAEVQAAYDQLYRLYDALFKDYNNARKDIKRERLKTKIAALLALIGGGAAIIK